MKTMVLNQFHSIRESNSTAYIAVTLDQHSSTVA
jgi:hypothetical protein